MESIMSDVKEITPQEVKPVADFVRHYVPKPVTGLTRLKSGISAAYYRRVRKILISLGKFH